MEESSDSDSDAPILVNKALAAKNWGSFGLSSELIDSLVANNFTAPTEV